VATTARIDPPITPDATVRIVTGTGGIVSVMSCTVRRGWGRVLHLIHRTVVLGVSEKPRALRWEWGARGWTRARQRIPKASVRPRAR